MLLYEVVYHFKPVPLFRCDLPLFHPLLLILVTFENVTRASYTHSPSLLRRTTLYSACASRALGTSPAARLSPAPRAPADPAFASSFSSPY